MVQHILLLVMFLVKGKSYNLPYNLGHSGFPCSLALSATNRDFLLSILDVEPFTSFQISNSKLLPTILKEG